MSGIDAALGRLEAAMDALEAEAARRLPDPDESVEALRRERDGLAEEVDALRAAAERDAELRSEAAVAVRSALSDLRALMPENRADG
jgi:hypothetical protein